MSKWIILIRIDSAQKKVDRVEHSGWDREETIKLLKQAIKFVKKQREEDIMPESIFI